MPNYTTTALLISSYAKLLSQKLGPPRGRASSSVLLEPFFVAFCSSNPPDIVTKLQ